MSDRDRNYLLRLLVIPIVYLKELFGIFLLFQMRFILGIESIQVVDFVCFSSSLPFIFAHLKDFH